MRIISIPLLLSLLLPACQLSVQTPPTPSPSASTTASPTPSASPSTSDAALGTPFTLNYKQTKQIGSENLSLSFDALVQDSRCPADVQCIRAGDVTVRVLVQQANGTPATLELMFGAGAEKSMAKFGKYTVTLQDIKPATTRSTEPHNPADYVLTLLVTG